ncbi:Uncharacterised protein [Legionella busanensis]|uniref:Uncharacterized protein n=1 Tax=Legionella busanensis TaxID=190655 RepID=A0A378K9I4_9GAMM|nr:DUF5677 domain-containing protein [Legionella busanensis]STX81608.1 Uncharacterised protein [Legionella busanensis]
MTNSDYLFRNSISEKLISSLVTEFTVLHKEFTKKTIPLIDSFVKSNFSSLREKILAEGKDIYTINSFKHRKFIKEWPKLYLPLFEKISLSLTLCEEYGVFVTALSQGVRAGSPILDVLLNFYMLSWNIADEVFYLLLGGYGNAAQSRWRSLYEIFIVSLFIIEKGSDCAVAFMEHAIIDEYNLMKKAEAYKNEIRQRPPTEKQFKDCISRYNFIISKYGKSFKEPYGWAKIFFSPIPKNRINFTNIEKCVNQSRMRFYYSDASLSTHPNAYIFYKSNGRILNNKRGSIPNLWVGHALALTLVQMASVVCTVIPSSIESLFMISLLIELVEQIGKELPNE